MLRVWWDEAGEVVSAMCAVGDCTTEWVGGSHMVMKRQRHVTLEVVTRFHVLVHSYITY